MRKTEYGLLNKQLKDLLAGETNWLANLANSAALLFEGLEDINWAGFYLLVREELVLGPFQGRPACVRIPLGKGVCGVTAQKKEGTVVADVHKFPGHIACDPLSRSEIVLPMLEGNRLLGVLDVDSPSLNRFDQEDQEGLGEFVSILVRGCDWSNPLQF